MIAIRDEMAAHEKGARILETQVLIQQVPQGVRLPARFADIDPIELARTTEDGGQALFQRFDLHTRQLVRSVIPLVLHRLDGDEWANVVRSHFQGDGNGKGLCRAPVLMFAGLEAIAGLGPSAHPQSLIYRLDVYVEIDHIARVALVYGVDLAELQRFAKDLESNLAKVTRPRSGGVHSAAGQEWERDASLSDYRERVDSIRAEIVAGRAKGVNLSLGLSRPTAADPFAIYRACVASNPSPYGFVLHDADFALVGSSPLAFMQLKGGVIHLETDAGTRAVGADASTNDAAEKDLLINPKDAAEHQVVVDAELEALKPIARDGRVVPVVSRKVRRFSHVMHLYSAFEVELEAELDAVDAIKSLAPAAAVSGYPKRVAIETARRVEGKARGPYGGVIGMIRSLADADLAVVIRSLWIVEGQANLRVGGKVVATSTAEAEYSEALSKSRFLVDAVAAAEQTQI